ncbi:MAG: hypothetical protein WCR70_04815 [Sphaerochaetaceae bacterium]
MITISSRDADELDMAVEHMTDMGWNITREYMQKPLYKTDLEHEDLEAEKRFRPEEMED